MRVFWFLPTAGDGHYLASSHGARAVDFDYLRQIAQAADRLGYYGVLLPTGRVNEDTWVAASSLVAVTNRLRFIVALRPGLMSPTLSARMAATFDRLSNGRLLINIVTSGDAVENAADGLRLSHDQRYELTDEFLHVWRALEQGETVNFLGKHLDIRDGKLLLPPVQKPYPPLYLGGSSRPAMEIAARHIDTYLTWGEPPALVAEKIAAVRELAERAGRAVRFGIRLHVIVRETEQEAWAAAEELIKYVTDDVIAAAQEVRARTESVGQRRMNALHNGRRDALVVGPNLWAGVGLVRDGAGTALVGSPENVAARIREYVELGVESFILSGYPHLEEAYRTAELLFPLLKPEPAPAPGATSESDPGVIRATGEAIARNIFPSLAQR